MPVATCWFSGRPFHPSRCAHCRSECSQPSTNHAQLPVGEPMPPSLHRLAGLAQRSDAADMLDPLAPARDAAAIDGAERIERGRHEQVVEPVAGERISAVILPSRSISPSRPRTRAQDVVHTSASRGKGAARLAS
jgi:hypothetical protein